MSIGVFFLWGIGFLEVMEEKSVVVWKHPCVSSYIPLFLFRGIIRAIVVIIIKMIVVITVTVGMLFASCMSRYICSDLHYKACDRRQLSLEG